MFRLYEAIHLQARIWGSSTVPFTVILILRSCCCYSFLVCGCLYFVAWCLSMPTCRRSLRTLNISVPQSPCNSDVGRDLSLRCHYTLFSTRNENQYSHTGVSWNARNVAFSLHDVTYGMFYTGNTVKMEAAHTKRLWSPLVKYQQVTNKL
jgi:hypothetical protein